MSIAIQNTNPQIDTFAGFIDRFNQSADVISRYAVTTALTNTGGVTTGNAAVYGTLSANVLATSSLRGGTVQTPATLVISSNVVSNSALTTLNSNNVIGGANTVVSSNVTHFIGTTVNVNAAIVVNKIATFNNASVFNNVATFNSTLTANIAIIRDLTANTTNTQDLIVTDLATINDAEIDTSNTDIAIMRTATVSGNTALNIAAVAGSIRGGTLTTPATLVISSNVVSNSALTTLNSNNIIGGSNTNIVSIVTHFNGQTVNVNANTVFNGGVSANTATIKTLTANTIASGNVTVADTTVSNKIILNYAIINNVADANTVFVSASIAGGTSSAGAPLVISSNVVSNSALTTLTSNNIIGGSNTTVTSVVTHFIGQTVNVNANTVFNGNVTMNKPLTANTVTAKVVDFNELNANNTVIRGDLTVMGNTSFTHSSLIASDTLRFNGQLAAYYLDYGNLQNVPTSFPPSAHSHTFASLTAKPTTLAGYGITDPVITTAGGTLVGNIIINKASPAIIIQDTAAGTVYGKFRTYSTANNYYITTNAAAAGDFSTETTLMAASSVTGVVTFPNDVYISGGVVWHSNNFNPSALSATSLTTGIVPSARLSGTYNITANNATNLAGQPGTYYTNLANASGTLAAARLSGVYSIDISGSAATASYATSAESANTANFANVATSATSAGTANNALFLNGQAGNYYTNLANSTGTLPAARLSGSYSISITGNAATATTATSATNATNAANATFATSAGTATNATNATNASTANNATYLGGNAPSWYTDLSNATGTLGSARLSGTYTINISGNAAYATNAGAATTATTATTATSATNANNAAYLNGSASNYYTDIPGRLGFTPVQQGTGAGQTSSTIKIGWSGSRLKAEVGTTDIGNIVFDSQLASASVSNATNLNGQASAYYLNAANFTGTLADARLPSTLTGKTFSSAISVTGTITATGNITANQTSDRRLKENVQPIGSALSKINSLNGYTFDWTQKGSDHTARIGSDYGIIAQELELVIPELVGTDADGYKYIKNGIDSLVPVLIEAVKELSRKVDLLTA